jgi:chorismate--pyruvate lyase
MSAWHSVLASSACTLYAGADIATPPPGVRLTPAWQSLVFGDGSPTRTLSLALRAPLRVDVLGMDALAASAGDDGVPVADALAALDGARVRRRVWLCAPDGERVGYAVSWWRASDAAELLAKTDMPIGASLRAARAEQRRELLLVARAEGHAELDAALGGAREGAGGRRAPLWARWYEIIHGGRTLCVVYEVFGAALERLLGPCEELL